MVSCYQGIAYVGEVHCFPMGLNASEAPLLRLAAALLIFWACHQPVETEPVTSRTQGPLFRAVFAPLLSSHQVGLVQWQHPASGAGQPAETLLSGSLKMSRPSVMAKEEGEKELKLPQLMVQLKAWKADAGLTAGIDVKTVDSPWMWGTQDRDEALQWVRVS